VVRNHEYTVTVDWTGSARGGTTSYTAYSRDHEVSVEGKAVILGSSDPSFRGDPARHNPEELLVAALSQCHMLSFLHRCATDGVVVVSYVDNARGTMAVSRGSGRFTEVVLHPVVTVTDASMVDRVPALHHAAHEDCFIANSVNFPVRCEPVTRVAEGAPA
jgi:organic hydroperoxide reductase OsmC/OhrA